MSGALSALVLEADEVVKTLRREPGYTEHVAMVSAYTMGFEAGLALGLLEARLGQQMLEVIDHEVLHDNRAATERERQQYLDHYRAALRDQQP